MRKSCSGRTVKPSAKAREEISQTTSYQNVSPTAEHNLKVENLVLYLTKLLNGWDNDEKREIQEEDPIAILATTINAVNTSNHDQFVCALQLDMEDPEAYAWAMQVPDATQWAKAMEEELDQLCKNKTWELIPASQMETRHCVFRGKWVYQVKRDVDGNIARFKARWVVKSYLQQYKVDFDQTFAAVVKPIAFRVLFAIAAFYNLDINQMDVKTAFLYGLIDQLIYVEIPKGTESESNQNMVCKLLKALYSLKQSPRLWYKVLSTFFLKKFGPEAN